MRARSIRLTLIVLLILGLAVASLAFRDININIPGIPEFERGGPGPSGPQAGSGPSGRRPPGLPSGHGHPPRPYLRPARTGGRYRLGPGRVGNHRIHRVQKPHQLPRPRAAADCRPAGTGATGHRGECRGAGQLPGHGHQRPDSRPDGRGAGYHQPPDQPLRHRGTHRTAVRRRPHNRPASRRQRHHNRACLHRAGGRPRTVGCPESDGVSGPVLRAVGRPFLQGNFRHPRSGPAGRPY